MEIVQIEKISAKLSFNNYIESDMNCRANLRCPNCRSNVSIKYKNLEKHAFSSHTNLSAIIAKQIEVDVLQSLSIIPDSFLDYNCPNCQNPIRIYYESWAGGRHGEAGFDLKFAISKLTELVNWEVEFKEQSNNVWQYKMVHELGSTVERIGTNLSKLHNEVRLDAIKINDELKE